MLEEIDFEQHHLPPDVTGSIVRLPLSDLIKVAHAVVPDLKSVVFVGDPWERQVIFRNWLREKSTAATGLNLTEIVGLSMAETRKRVATLPEHSAIIYSEMYSDGEGVYFPPATALALIAEKANRPIVVVAETFLAPGGIGGFVLVPGAIGGEAAKLALRVLSGESPSSIPAALIQAVKPIFNWPQMQRWYVGESDLPPGSEIRLRELSFWQRYRLQSIFVAAVIILQGGSYRFCSRSEAGEMMLKSRRVIA
jgi:ABC-type uncharacterized transport system substrate-binding protein